MELEKGEIVWKHDARRAEISSFSNFSKFRVFPISTSVDITVYPYRKNVLYFFYNIAQKEYKITSVDERREIFRVYIGLCKHGS